MTAKLIMFYNPCGGVGKTTLTLIAGDGLQRLYGRRVLFVDLDGLCSLSRRLGYNGDIWLQTEKHIKYSSRHFVQGKIERQGKGLQDIQMIYHPDACYYSDGRVERNWTKPTIRGDLIPADSGLFYYSRYTGVKVCGNDTYLINPFRTWIDELSEHYDVIFLDCPPGYGLLAQQASLTVDYLIPVIEAGLYESLRGCDFIMWDIHRTQHPYEKTEELWSRCPYKTEIPGIVVNKSQMCSSSDFKSEAIKRVNTKFKWVVEIPGAYVRERDVLIYNNKGSLFSIFERGKSRSRNCCEELVTALDQLLRK